MARAALNWSMRDLAREAGVSVNTISRYENGTDAMGDTLTRIQRCFEAAGLAFLGDGAEGGVGVRFRAPR
ncbi:MAG: helix-turn-helix domain-containing protein [Alphaproteobacteria bacterium]